MSFSKNITIPANVPKHTPVEHEVIVTNGEYSSISVFFPPGCKGQVGIQVRHHGELLAPSSAADWGRQDANDFTVAARPVKLKPPYILTLTAYNTGTEPHTLTFKGD